MLRARALLRSQISGAIAETNLMVTPLRLIQRRLKRNAPACDAEDTAIFGYPAKTFDARAKAFLEPRIFSHWDRFNASNYEGAHDSDAHTVYPTCTSPSSYDQSPYGPGGVHSGNCWPSVT